LSIPPVMDEELDALWLVKMLPEIFLEVFCPTPSSDSLGWG